MLYVELIFVTFFLVLIAGFKYKRNCLRRLNHLWLTIKGINKYEMLLLKIRENTDDSLKGLQKEACKSFDKINEYLNTWLLCRINNRNAPFLNAARP